MAATRMVVPPLASTKFRKAFAIKVPQDPARKFFVIGEENGRRSVEVKDSRRILGANLCQTSLPARMRVEESCLLLVHCTLYLAADRSRNLIGTGHEERREVIHQLAPG